MNLQLIKFLCVSVLGGALVACGGGGSSGSTSTGSTTTSAAVTAATCSSLSSGTYRVASLGHKNLSGVGNSDETWVVDASALTFSSPAYSTEVYSLVPVTGDTCHFNVTTNNGTGDVVVSSTGVWLTNAPSTTSARYRSALAFPEQSHALSDLAGTWNMLGMQVTAGSADSTGVAATASIDASGQLSALQWCQNDSTWAVTDANCQSLTTSLPVLSANASGGFNVTAASASSATGRAFLYQAPGGDWMYVQLDGDGSFQLRTKQQALALPTAGAATGWWSVVMSNSYALAAYDLLTFALTTFSETIVSVDSSANSWLRTTTSTSNGTTRVIPSTFFANNPRNGYSFRAAGSVLASDGSSVSLAEITVLPMPGLGGKVLLIPASKQFQLTLAKP